MPEARIPAGMRDILPEKMIKRQYVLDRFESMARSGEQAMETPNQKDACVKWKRHLGSRFPCEMAEDTLDDAKAFPAPAFIRSDARSA